MIIRWRRILGLLIFAAIVTIVVRKWDRLGLAFGSITLTELGYRYGRGGLPDQLTLLVWALVLVLVGVLIGKAAWGGHATRQGRRGTSK
ncbi:MAG: hypothetical protein KAS72_11150 [Phycisphaerales bacterium]|nr:hypothetical protein [Phycisphaerales bacterium]